MDEIYVVFCEEYLIGVFVKKEDAEKAKITEKLINPNAFIKIMKYKEKLEMIEETDDI